MGSSQLEAYRRRVLIDFPAHQKAGAKRHLIDTAKRGHREIAKQQRIRSGVSPEYEAYANHPGNPNLESVKLPGPIVYRYFYLREVIVAAMEALFTHSPVVSGLYRSAHILFIDGVPANVPTAEDLRPGQQIMIANAVPYARRLEVGLTTTGRPFVIQVPPRIYERVVKKVLRPRFRQVAKISFGYANLPGAYIIKGRLPPFYIGKGGYRRRRRQQVGAPVQAPAIFIDPLG